MDVGRYLQRIGYDGPLTVDAATLAGLQRAHLGTVPFDALDCALGRPVTVWERDAYAKVVDRGRGGYCFELNGLFAWLLEQLGFEVVRLAAQPLTRSGAWAPPFAHLTLLVPLERRWLADVGFGSGIGTEPLDLDDRGEQVRDGEVFRIREDGEWLVAEQLDVEEPNAFRFTLEPRTQADFEERCRAFSTDPESPFVRSGVVMLGGRRVRRDDFSDEREWRAQLREQFGYDV